MVGFERKKGWSFEKRLCLNRLYLGKLLLMVKKIERGEGCTLRENVLKKGGRVCGGMEGIIDLEMGQKSK